MAAVQKVVDLFQQFKEESLKPNHNSERCQKLLANLKVSLLEFESLPPIVDPTKVSQQELLLARETFELAALFSIKEKDVDSFEKHCIQAKMYYTDFDSVLPASQRRLPLLGANLLRLLAQNRIADFHMELALIPESDHESVFIKHPIAVEQVLMEGAYNKILSAQAEVPAESYLFFMSMLVDMARGEIADCIEEAYEKLAIEDVAQLLRLSAAETEEFLKTKEWEVRNGEVILAKEETLSKEDLPSVRLITESIAWAKELERIV
eukprot:CAMPEP_0113880438 /NCGR_PEP_ID=MMETSP0780_2-20120614/7786_1 /TAXON_ID=652834 /ORGANISM="Palpitomonas bilix" /LENGTH=264 /DNA_ID=CAMNT_0000867115 /DNA_START=130 /DNA_END=924 /DNA_ORIENTATION=- /assembly_acc=CAM_ASM_000599